MTAATAAMPASPTRPLDKYAAALALLLGLGAILGAWGSQIFGGLVPCELCWEQRTPYYYGLPILAVVLLLWNRLPLAVWYIAMAIVAAIFAWSTYLGAYHAGVEWGWWPGPTACTGSGGGTSLGELEAFRTGSGDVAHIVPCDEVQFRFLGISLAGYNALVSAAIVVLVGLAAWWQAKRVRR